MQKFFEKWEKGLAKTRKGIWGRISDVFGGRQLLDEDILEELEQILIEGDVGVETSLKIVEDVKEALSRGESRSADQVHDLLRQEILLKDENMEIVGGWRTTDFNPVYTARGDCYHESVLMNWETLDVKSLNRDRSLVMEYRFNL